jgi:hypothetical protein
MIICVLAIGWAFIIVIKFPWNIFCISINFWQSVIFCPFKPQMWHAHEDVFYGFWISCVSSMVATMACFFFFLHVFTLWFIIPQFVQYLSIFVVLLYVFASATCFVFYGIESALLVFLVIMFFSHNIVTFLCCCNVDCFILEVVILRYDSKPTLKTIGKKLSMVGTYRPWANFWILS